MIRLACAALCVSICACAQPSVTAWEILHLGIYDKNPERRKQAVTAIGSIGLNPEAIKMVEHGLRDDDSVVRQTAAAELADMKSTGSIPALKAALDDPAGEVAFTAAKALIDMGDNTGEEIMRDVLTGQQKSTGSFIDGAVRDAKAKMHSPRALALIGVKEASGMLLGPFSIGVTAGIEMMKDGGAAGRAVAATMLSRHCNEYNMKVLETTLGAEKNNAVKAAVAKAVGACGNKDEIPRLEQYLSSGNDALRLMSAAAIVRLSLVPDKPAADFFE